MKQIINTSLSTHQGAVNCSRIMRLIGAGTIAFGMTSCITDQTAAGLGQMMDTGYSYGGRYLPSDARNVVNAVRALHAIAKYQASEKQLSTARSKAKKSKSTERQYIRVKPETAASGKKSTPGTHVVAYEPSTGKLDDEVLVVPETDLSKGESVSINGQSGKII